MGHAKGTLIWCTLATVIAVPIIVAAASPLLAWREPVYVAAGFAGVIALTLLLLQPLLAGGKLPGLPVRLGRRVHRVAGGVLVGAVIVHVAGLWVTSPPDVIDALLFSSPTPFSFWGVIAMWAIFAAALIAVFRRRLRPRTWRIGHTTLVTLVVVASVVHTMLIEGTMGMFSKAALCCLVLAATAKIMVDLRVWRLLSRRGAQRGEGMPPGQP